MYRVNIVKDLYFVPNCFLRLSSAYFIANVMHELGLNHANLKKNSYSSCSLVIICTLVTFFQIICFNIMVFIH